MSTMLLSTDTPDSVMKPTAAEIDSGMSRTTEGQDAADAGERHAGEARTACPSASR